MCEEGRLLSQNALLDKYNEYLTVVGYSFEYEFDDGSVLVYTLKKKNFPHLIGLHKLSDIPIIADFNDPNKNSVSAGFIMSRIRKERFLTDDIVRSSIYFPIIKERYENFSRDNLLTLTYTDVIVDFNARLIGSTLKSRYILFESKNMGYDNLGIAFDKANKSYVETFFYNSNDLYMRNQKLLKVKRARIFDKAGTLYLEDEFIN